MTLTLTAFSEKRIFQCADYRLTNTVTGERYDFDTQKIFVVSRQTWNAILTFAGVGSTASLNIADWVRERIDAIAPKDPFDRLIDELLKAKTWLATVPDDRRNHSFHVGAFVKNEARFWKVTNFEKSAALVTSHELIAIPIVPPRLAIYASGAASSVTDQHRKSLTAILSKNLGEDVVYTALANINRKVAALDKAVSPQCFTGHINIIGQGGGKPHGFGERRPLRLGTAIRTQASSLDHPFIKALVGSATNVGATFARHQPDEAFLRLQVAERPDSASAHSNLAGYFLRERDFAEAENSLKVALELDPRNGPALCNYALVAALQGNLEEAEARSISGLAANPENPHLYLHYAKVLAQGRRFVDALDILTKGLVRFPESAEYYLLSGNLRVELKRPKEALQDFRKARSLGADEKECQVNLAFAAHLAGESPGTCIAEYLTAITLVPDDFGLHLNLAQLLFIQGDERQAAKHLDDALRLNPSESAMLEYLFYKICHLDDDWDFVRKRASAILAKGHRLDWDMTPNLQLVLDSQPRKADQLHRLLESMRGNAPIEAFEP